MRVAPATAVDEEHAINGNFFSSKLTRRRAMALGLTASAAAVASPAIAGNAVARAATINAAGLPGLDLETATIQQWHGLLASRRLSSVQLCELYLDRIAQLNWVSPSLNAVRVINPDWRRDAQKVDVQRARGVDLGPMMGIPVLVKDPSRVNPALFALRGPIP